MSLSLFFNSVGLCEQVRVHSVPNYSGHCKTKLNTSTEQSDINMFSSGQVYFKILGVPFAKLAFKILLPNVMPSLTFTHCAIVVLAWICM